MANISKVRSIRLAVDDATLALAHKLAHRAEMSLTEYFLSLLRADAARHKIETKQVKK